MLLGRFDSTIGEKHQTGLPKKFREILGDTIIVTKGFEHSLIIVSEKEWETLLEGSEGRPFTNKTTRELQRFLLGNATQAALDTKGRFVIPEYLRKYAKLSNEIVFVGVRRYVEVWDKKEWENHQEELSKTIESIAERLDEEG